MKATVFLSKMAAFWGLLLAVACGPAPSTAPSPAAPSALTGGDPPSEADSPERVEPHSGARILVMGDSMMAWHSLTQKSVSHAMEEALGEPVASTAVSGARVLYNLPISGAMGMKIGSQLRKGDWDWIVLNGGGNDLWFGCGCGTCRRKMDRLISEDGTQGAIVMLVQALRDTGAQVAWVGYLRSPGVWSPIEGCRDNGDALEARIDRLAALDPGVHFVSLSDLVPHGDRSFHGVDMIHPSLKGSRAIGQRVAAVIRANDAAR